MQMSSDARVPLSFDRVSHPQEDITMFWRLRVPLASRLLTASLIIALPFVPLASASVALAKTTPDGGDCETVTDNTGWSIGACMDPSGLGDVYVNSTGARDAGCWIAITTKWTDAAWWQDLDGPHDTSAPCTPGHYYGYQLGGGHHGQTLASVVTGDGRTTVQVSTRPVDLPLF
jgi:hypothetical protein